MYSKTTQGLRRYLKRKGISISGEYRQRFSKYDYFQVINGYKGLFISGVENMDRILENLQSGIDLDRYRAAFSIPANTPKDDCHTRIIDSIVDKYGLDVAKTASVDEKLSAIKSIQYVHHVYSPNADYADFCRMYDFEHELRNVLLKYTLMIEDNIKRIFIGYLNDQDKSPDFLVDISNYNTAFTGRGKNGAFQTIKRVIDLLDNTHSNPIQRKRKQNLPVPYWILINEMTLNQTLRTISNLNQDDKDHILQGILHEFTDCTSVDVFDTAGKTAERIDSEKGHLRHLAIMLRYIGEFRNSLAHNQPIYNYNVANVDLSCYPNIRRAYPAVKYDPKRSIEEQQQRVNAGLMRYINRFFGTDSFSSRSVDINVDLSFIIYVVNQIICRIKPSSTFKQDVLEVYRKYHVLLGYPPYHRLSPSFLEELERKLQVLDGCEAHLVELKSRIENNRPYKAELKRLEKAQRDGKRQLLEYMAWIKAKSSRSDYPPFSQGQAYKLFTNIDASFLLGL